MTLEDQVRRFAQESRAMLLSQAGQQAAGGIAEWVGYSSSGKGLVRQNGRTRQVNVIGNISLKRGQLVLLDANDTIQIMDLPFREQPRRTGGRQDFSISPPFKKQRSIILSTLFPEELEEEEGEEIFEFPVDTGFYVVTYTTYSGEAAASEFFIKGVPYDGAFVPTIEDVRVLPAIGSPAVYRLEAAGVSAFAAFPGASASASVSGGGISISVTSQNGDYGRDVAMELQKSNTLSSYDTNITLTELADGALGINVGYISFPKAIYYFQGPNNNEDQVQIRKIDLNKIAPNQIYGHNMDHNYITREGSGESEQTYVYSIFRVHCVDMNDSNTVTDYSDSSFRQLIREYGKNSYYWIHTRLSMNTGELETKITDVTSSSGGNEYLVWASASATSSAFECVAGASVQIRPSSSVLSSIKDFEPVWSQSYPGDWLYAYRNIAWNEAAQANITIEEMGNFLSLSYKKEKFYYGWDSPMPLAWTAPNPAYFYEWTPTGSWVGGGPNENDFHDIENLQSIVLNSSNQISFDSYFDGSVEGAPGDIDQWILWSFYDVDHKGPSYIPSDEVTLFGIPQLTVVDPPPWFSYVPPSS